MSDKINYIISLIGKNPLPSFITILGHLDSNPNVILVFSEATKSNIGTKRVAENIKEVLLEKNPEIKVFLRSCDKSSPEEIESVVGKILTDIDNDAKNNDNIFERGRVLLDYSSGTKAMSAIFYDRVINYNSNHLYTLVSYVDDKEEKIIIFSKKLNIEKSITIEDAIDGRNISIADITRLHGYKLKDPLVAEVKCDSGIKYIKANGKITFLNSITGNVVEVDEVALSRASLILCFDSESQDAGGEKFELFRIKYFANKIGGDRSKFIYRSNFINVKGENYKTKLEKDVARAYEFDMRDRCYLIDEYENFKEFIENNFVSTIG